MNTTTKRIDVTGTIIVTYKILCQADLNKIITLKELLANEKIAKVIKSEFAKGFRNIALLEESQESSLKIETL